MSEQHIDSARSECGNSDFSEMLIRSPNVTFSRISGTDAATQTGKLARAIETSVIPRLLLNHGVRPAGYSEREDAEFEAGAVEKLAEVAFSTDSILLFEHVEDLLGRGYSKERVLLELLAPAARLMGDMWTADLCSFVDVTLGLSRLQHVLRRFNGLDDHSGVPAGSAGQALLVPAPGEQHTFGLRVVEEFLLRDGWSVRCSLRATLHETLAMIAEDHFDFIGFSASGEALINSLKLAISGVRDKSMNPNVKILVGGVLFAVKPELADELGVDGCVSDPRTAVSLARSWSAAGSTEGTMLS